MINIDFKQCTFCTSCIQACPAKCITIKEIDKTPYPEIEQSKCIHCDICQKVCPLENKREKNSSIQKAFAFALEEHEDLMKSSSGGAFYAIAKTILDRNGVVYGSAMCDDLRVRHIRVETLGQLKLLQGSKYTQSDLGDTFITIKSDLLRGKEVLFVGTPCQVDGLNCFLRKKYDNLLTIDIVCHGNAPQRLFKECLMHYEETKRIKIKSFEFRKKYPKKNAMHSVYRGIVTYEQNNKLMTKKITYFDLYYYYYFVKAYIFRSSCYSCKYSNLNRAGDLTIGDLWGANNFDLSFETSHGCSLILTNTSKGEEIIRNLKDKKEIDLSLAASFNKQLNEPVKRPDDGTVMSLFQKDSIEIYKYFRKKEFLKIILGKFKYNLPEWVYKIVSNTF